MGITFDRSNDAGRYGGSKPSDLMVQFIAIASELHPVDRQTTTLGNSVELSYNPGSMDADTRKRLLDVLLGYIREQESWHQDWFLWNVVRLNEDGVREIRLSIS